MAGERRLCQDSDTGFGNLVEGFLSENLGSLLSSAKEENQRFSYERWERLPNAGIGVPIPRLVREPPGLRGVGRVSSGTADSVEGREFVDGETTNGHPHLSEPSHRFDTLERFSGP